MRDKKNAAKNINAYALLRRHFGRTALESLTVSTRTFASRVRADLQLALTELFDGSASVVHFGGVRSEFSFHALDFGALTTVSRSPPTMCPAEFEAVDIGETEPVRCLKVGLWLLADEGERYAVLMAPTDSRGSNDIAGTRFFVAARNTPKGEAWTTHFFRRLELAVARSRSYRGKVLSLESSSYYSGRSSGISVHRLPPVSRDQLVLPPATLELLERNVIGFCARRALLAQHGQSLRKGLLFYGPPGTGKTHTIRYLAGLLKDHTTLLITAEQVGLLPEYMALARLLQPSIVVIEDADLIARDRTSMDSVCTEVALNKLLNEMDGLKEDAQILFILTTNRPETLEAALAARPGRVDQAIEFPLPDEAGRRTLARLYGKGLDASEEVIEAVVSRTDGVSAAFIKELMRRAMQFRLERPNAATLELQDIHAALEEILFKGGTLNTTLLGGKPHDK
jgi:hypothetical protein